MEYDYSFLFPPIGDYDKEFLDSFEWYLENNQEQKAALWDGLVLNPWDFLLEGWLEQVYGEYLYFCQQNDFQPITRFRYYTHLAYMLHDKREQDNDAENLYA